MSLPFRSGLAAIALSAAIACSNPEADKQRHLQRGDELAAQQKHAEAIIEYRNAVRIDERAGDTRYKLAQSYEATGDARNAFREYIRAADLLPDNVDVQLKASAALAATGRFEDAKARLQGVLDKHPKHVSAQVLMGSVLAGLRDIDGAVAQVEESIQIEPGRGSSHTSLGMLRLAQGDRDAARAAFDKALAADPRSIDAHLALAMFQLTTGDTAGAEQTLTAALRLDEKHPVANRAMAALYLLSNRAAQAEPYVKAYVAAVPSTSATFALADYYAGIGRSDEARSALQPLTEVNASAADANARLAQLEYGGDRAAAHARIDQVLTRTPQHVPSLLLKARWLLGEGKKDEALSRAEAAAKAAPDNPAAQFLVGEIQVQRFDTAAATAAFTEVLRLNPRVAAAQLQLSRLELATGSTTEAVQLAESALKSAPGSPDARLTLAQGLIARRELDRADPLVTELLKQFPDTAAVVALDGMRQLARNNFPAARTAYERALQLDSTSFTALAGLTALDVREQKHAAALTRVQSRLTAAPDDSRVLLLMARLHMTTGQPAEAERALRRVIALTPADSSAYAMLGQVYVAQKKLPEARAEFDSAAARNPKDLAARTVAAMLTHQSNDLADAKKRYRDILDRDPKATVAANNLAWILAEEGADLDEALRLAQQATTLAPTSAEAQDTLGWVYLRKELASLAIAPFERSVAAAPDNPTYHYHLALAHAKTGNTAAARQAVASALKLRADYSEARELQSTLRN